MFDANPKMTPADRYVAGKTTEQVVRAILDATTAKSGVGAESVPPTDVLSALVARFDRKAARRAGA